MTPDRIITAATAITGIGEIEITGPRRDAHLVRARRAVMVIARDDYGLSTTAIGRLLNRDHTTVIHGLRGARARIGSKYGEGLTGDIESMRRWLRADAEIAAQEAA